MLTLALYLLLLWVVLTGFLAAWTLWFQAYIYSEAVDKIYWRAPAAGSALGVFFLLWVWLDYGTDGRFTNLIDFSPGQSRNYEQIVIETPDGMKETYKRYPNGKKGFEYLKDGRKPRSNPRRVFVTEGGQQLIFEPERNAKDHYVNKETGQVMLDGYLGQASTFRWWWLLQYVFVNLLHFVIWWACLWLLLKFQFWHSCGMAMAAWLAMTLFILPPLLNRAEETGKQRAAKAPTNPGPFVRQRSTSGGDPAQDVSPAAGTAGPVQGVLLRFRPAPGTPTVAPAALVVDSYGGPAVLHPDGDLTIVSTAVPQSTPLRGGLAVGAVPVAVAAG